MGLIGATAARQGGNKQLMWYSHWLRIWIAVPALILVSALLGGRSAPSTQAQGHPKPGAPLALQLLVTSRNTNSVMRYDGTTGAFIDAFVAPSSGGLSQPWGLRFAPDGNLLVSS